MNNNEKLIKAIVEGIQEKKGHNITIVNLREISDSITQYLVICEGNSPTQVFAIYDSLCDYVRKHTGQKPVSADGVRNSLWIAMDYTDVVVHIFLPETREFYDIDHLWEDATVKTIPNID
jgi:ribosome-associated protein